MKHQIKKIRIPILIGISIIALGLIIWRYDLTFNRTISYPDCSCSADYRYSLTNYGYENIKTAGHAGDNDMSRDNAKFEVFNCLCVMIAKNYADSDRIKDTILNAVKYDNRLKRRYIVKYNYDNLKIETDTILKYYQDFFKYDSTLLVNYELFKKSGDNGYLNAAIDSITRVEIYRYQYLHQVGLKENVPIKIDFIVSNRDDIFRPLMIY